MSEVTRTCWCTAAVLFLALGAVQGAPAQTTPPPAASEPTPAKLWATMLKSHGTAYVAARDELLRSGAASAILEAKLTDPDWRVQAVARAGLERLSRPQAYAEYEAGLAGGLREIYRHRAHPLRGVGVVWRRPSDPTPYFVRREDLYGAAGVPFLLEALAKGAAPPADWYIPERPGAGEAARDLYSRVAQCYAALTLSRLADPRAITPLLDVLGAGEFSELRRYAAIGLGSTGRADVIAPLRKALQDPDPEVRGGAVGGLGLVLTDPDDPDLVWLAQNDPDLMVRGSARAALLKICSRLRIMEQGGRKVPNP